MVEDFPLFTEMYYRKKQLLLMQFSQLQDEFSVKTRKKTIHIRTVGGLVLMAHSRDMGDSASNVCLPDSDQRLQPQFPIY